MGVSDTHQGTAAPVVPANTPIEPVAIDDGSGHVVHKFHARNVSLIVVAVLATLFALKSAIAFVVPLVLAIILAYALDPIVAFLERRGIPRPLATLLLMAALLAAAGMAPIFLVIFIPFWTFCVAVIKA